MFIQNSLTFIGVLGFTNSAKNQYCSMTPILLPVQSNIFCLSKLPEKTSGKTKQLEKNKKTIILRLHLISYVLLINLSTSAYYRMIVCGWSISVLFTDKQ